MTEPRIDPDKLLELCRKRFKNDQPRTYREGYVTISWAFATQIIDELRECRPPARMATTVPVTEAMVAAAEEAHMPFGDMRAALEMALAEALS